MVSEPAASDQLGYEERRADLERYVDEHYIERFDLAPCTMLDAGCGDGFWSDIFARRGFLVQGIDVSYAAIERARRRCMTRFNQRGYEAGLLPVFHCTDLLRPPAGYTPALIFARTLPQFYQPTLEPGVQLLANFVKRCAANGKILLSIYTEMPDDERYTKHQLADLLACAIHAGATLADKDEAGGYLNLLLEPDRRTPRR